MPLHFLYELPKPVSRELKEYIPSLTEEEERIIKTQVRRNSSVIQDLIKKIDLFAKEKFEMKI